jgi:hypothetical protein
MLYNSGSMWPSVVVHEHWPVSQRMIWGGLFTHGDGSTGLMKVVFCYALPTAVQGFGANETLHFRTTTFWPVRVLMWPPNAKLPRSAPAVLNGRCRARLDMIRSSLGVVLRGLPARVIAMLDLTGYMIIWGGLFAHGDGSTGLMKVVFCYALPTAVQGFGANETFHFRTTTFLERAHCHGIFGLSDYHQEHTSPTYSQRKNNPRQLHPHPQKQLCPKCGCPRPH